MIKEAYVSFEVAKLLKEKGFNEECRSYFVDNGNTFRNCAVHIKSINCTSDQILRPTHQMAMAWLREDKNIFIEISTRIDLNGRYHYSYSVLDKECKYLHKGYTFFDWTYEEAVEAALKYALENLGKEAEK